MGVLGTLGSLNVLLSADTTTFTGAMEKAAYVADRNLAKIALKGKLTVAAITTAVTAAGTALAVSINKSLDHADKLGKMAQSIGLTVEQLSSLEYAAKLSNLSLDELRVAFQKFDKAIFEGSKGSKEQANAFKSLGISITDTGGNIRRNYDLFIESAEALSRMENGAQKTALAMVLFGKNGASLLPMLNGGKEGLKQLADEAEKLGVVISANTAASAEIFNDNMVRLAESVQGVINKITEGMLPSLVALSEHFKTSQTSLENFSTAGEFFGNWLAGITSVVEMLIVDLRVLNLVMRLEFGKAEELVKSFAADQEKMWSAIATRSQTGTTNAQKSLRDYTDSLNTFNKKQEEGKTLTESLKTAQEKYNDEMIRYNDLLASGAISQETFERAASKAKETLDKSATATSKLKNVVTDLGFTFQSAFEDAILEGKKLSEVLMSLLKDIERIVIRKAITEPIANWITAAIPTYGGTKTTTPSRHGNIFSSGNLIPFATGGLVTRPTLFPMANGGTGLAGEAGTEAIMPLFRTPSGDLGVKSGGARGVEVNVYAPAGSKVSQNRRTAGDMEQINIMIDEAVAGSVNDPGSKTHRALKNSFGLRQSLTTR